MQSIGKPQKKAVAVRSEIEQIDISGCRQQIAVHAVSVIVELGYLYDLVFRTAVKELSLLGISERSPLLCSVLRGVAFDDYPGIVRDDLLHLVSDFVDV